MLRILNSNSTTYYTHNISVTDEKGDISTRDKLVSTLKNLLSIKNSAIERDIEKYKSRIPFKVNTTADALVRKDDIYESIGSLKIRLNEVENKLSHTKSNYISQLCKLKTDYINNITQCQRIIHRINLGIPIFENKVELFGTTLLPEELNRDVIDQTTGIRMTMNDCISHVRQKALSYEANYESKEIEFHHILTKSIDESKVNIRHINSQLEILNTALEQQGKIVNSARHIIDATDSPQKIIGTLKDLLLLVKKQEKYRTNATTALQHTRQQEEVNEWVQTGNIDALTAVIAKNQSFSTSSLHIRQPIVYELVKADNEALIYQLDSMLGAEELSTEFKRDVLQQLAMLKNHEGSTTSPQTTKETLDEIMSVLYNASDYSPALISEGQYLALSKKIARAYNTKLPNLPALMSQAQTIFDVTLPAMGFDSDRLSTLIRYLSEADTHHNG